MHGRLFIVLLILKVFGVLIAVLVIGGIAYRIATSKTIRAYITRFRLRDWE